MDDSNDDDVDERTLSRVQNRIGYENARVIMRRVIERGMFKTRRPEGKAGYH